MDLCGLNAAFRGKPDHVTFSPVTAAGSALCSISGTNCFVSGVGPQQAPWPQPYTPLDSVAVAWPNPPPRV